MSPECRLPNMPDDGQTPRDVAEQIILAVDRYLRPFIVPILQRESAEPHHLGTATLFRVCGANYLVTAHHVIDDVDPQSLLISAKEPRLRALASLISHTAHSADDVAVMRLTEEARAELVAGGHRFTTVEHLRPILGDEQAFVIPGYTSATTTRTGHTLTGDFNTFMSPRYAGPAEDSTAPVDHNIDLFLRHTNMAGTLDNIQEQTPHLAGISGTSVWAILSPAVASGAVWSPQSQLRLVAVETACKRGSYIRATRWHAVAAVIGTLDEPAGVQILSALVPPPKR